jgi:hypothetical protein
VGGVSWCNNNTRAHGRGVWVASLARARGGGGESDPSSLTSGVWVLLLVASHDAARCEACNDGASSTP